MKSRSSYQKHCSSLPALMISGVLGLSVMTPAQSGWQDWLDKATETAKDVADTTMDTVNSVSPKAASDKQEVSDSSDKPTADEQNKGLREAIAGFADAAIQRLGAKDGFLGDSALRIQLPEQLGPIKKGLSALGQQGVIDDFETSINRAAEQAVKDSAPVFVKAVEDMSILDAAQIIGGEDNAATEYFREKTGAALRERMLPQVQKVTGQTGVTSNYKAVMDKAGFLASYLDKDTLDLDSYVTEESLNGLFTAMAEEEKRLRADPAGAGTELIRKVFSFFK